MPGSSIGLKNDRQLDRLIRFIRQNKIRLALGGAAVIAFSLAVLQPSLATPLALALTVLALRRRS